MIELYFPCLIQNVAYQSSFAIYLLPVIMITFIVPVIIVIFVNVIFCMQLFPPTQHITLTPTPLRISSLPLPYLPLPSFPTSPLSPSPLAPDQRGICPSPLARLGVPETMASDCTYIQCFFPGLYSLPATR